MSAPPQKRVSSASPRNRTPTPRDTEAAAAARAVAYFGSPGMVTDVTQRLFPNESAKLAHETRLRRIQQDMYPELFESPVVRQSDEVAKHADEMLKRSLERRKVSIERTRDEMYHDVGVQYKDRAPVNAAEWVRRTYDIPVSVSTKARVARVACDAAWIQDKVRARQSVAAKMIFEANRPVIMTVVANHQKNPTDENAPPPQHAKRQHSPQSKFTTSTGRKPQNASLDKAALKGFMKFEHELRKLKEREEGFRHAVKVKYVDAKNLIGGEVSAALMGAPAPAQSGTAATGPSDARLRQLSTPRGGTSPRPRTSSAEPHPAFRLYSRPR